MTCEEWPIVWGCDTEPDDTDDPAAAARTASAIAAAQALLWSRTGRRLGVCTFVDEYRLESGSTCSPCLPEPGGRWFMFPPAAPLAMFLHLDHDSVVDVTSVAVAGATLDPTAYRVQAGALIRTDRHGWPARVPIVVAGSAGVSVGEGSALYGLVGIAMGEVAHELLEAMCGNACKLSSRAVSVSRAGVTVDLGVADSEKGTKLGLEVADQLIGTVNPGGLRSRSRVYSPDIAQRVY